LRRKQVFAAALKRVNREIDRMHKLEARAAHVEAARRALAMRRAAQFPARPPSGDTASEGMRALPNRRRRTKDRKRVTSDKECTSRSRRPQLKNTNDRTKLMQLKCPLWAKSGHRDVLTMILTFHGLRNHVLRVRAHRSRPTSSRHIAQALHLARASGRGLGEMS
jgi:hypothetical protein